MESVVIRSLDADDRICERPLAPGEALPTDVVQSYVRHWMVRGDAVQPPDELVCEVGVPSSDQTEEFTIRRLDPYSREYEYAAGGGPVRYLAPADGDATTPPAAAGTEASSRPIHGREGADRPRPHRCPTGLAHRFLLDFTCG